MKFKIGDKVRILDGADIEDYAGGWVDDMYHYIGKIYTVRFADEFGVRLENSDYRWDERGLELVEAAEQPKEDEPKVEVKARESKEHFMMVATEVTHDFDDVLHKEPTLILLLAMYTSKLAHKLFD